MHLNGDVPWAVQLQQERCWSICVVAGTCYYVSSCGTPVGAFKLVNDITVPCFAQSFKLSALFKNVRAKRAVQYSTAAQCNYALRAFCSFLARLTMDL
jgi:hypothetical protein